MGHGPICIAVAVAAAACSFNASYDGTLYACGQDGSCPDHYVCLDQRCVPTEPIPAACTTAVTAGDAHTCAVRTDHTGWCWGNNDFGQLGDGTTTTHASPVQVAATGLPNLTEVAAGSSHSCGLGVDHSVWCWGHNNAGQLGNGMMSDNHTPVSVANVTDAVAIAAGDAHTCAVSSAGGLVCWGADDAGQLGNDSTSPSNVPVAVALAGVTAVAAGGATTCAVDTGNALWCWGANDLGQLGVPASDPQLMPIRVPVDAVKAVAVGRQFVCALTTAGAVFCSGKNDQGQLGADIGGGSAMPVAVALPVAASAIAAGATFACALEQADDRHAQARVWCWGQNDDFQLADGTRDRRVVPALTTYSGIAAIAGGGGHLCTVSAGNALACSGFNGFGQLGDGKPTLRGAPSSPITGLAPATAIAAGGTHSCALLADHTVACWGDNTFGQLGDGSLVERSRPVAVEGVPHATAIVAGGNHSCAVLADQQTVACWGANFFGQLGDGTNDSRGSARAVVDASGAKLTGVTQLAAAGDHTCALVGNGGVMCWGRNLSGQNGNGGINDSNLPIAVSMLTGASAVTAGIQHACAINAMNTVECWGDDGVAQLGGGNMSSTTPVVTAFKGMDQISAHYAFTCGRVQSSHTVGCWGFGGDGELGDGAHQTSGTLRQAKGVTDVVKVASGDGHACAIKSDGTLRCWGASYTGQVGDNGYDHRDVPVLVSSVSGVSDVAGGGGHTCAVADGDSVRCWGDDRDGQLGDGVSASPTPVAPQLPCP